MKAGVVDSRSASSAPLILPLLVEGEGGEKGGGGKGRREKGVSRIRTPLVDHCKGVRIEGEEGEKERNRGKETQRGGTPWADLSGRPIPY